MLLIMYIAIRTQSAAITTNAITTTFPACENSLSPFRLAASAPSLLYSTTSSNRSETSSYNDIVPKTISIASSVLFSRLNAISVSWFLRYSFHSFCAFCIICRSVSSVIREAIYVLNVSSICLLRSSIFVSASCIVCWSCATMCLYSSLRKSDVSVFSSSDAITEGSQISEISVEPSLIRFIYERDINPNATMPISIKTTSKNNFVLIFKFFIT